MPIQVADQYDGNSLRMHKTTGETTRNFASDYSQGTLFASWSLQGAGNVITFSTYVDRGETCLSIVAVGPQQWSDKPGVSWVQVNLVAKTTWQTLQSNVRQALAP